MHTRRKFLRTAALGAASATAAASTFVRGADSATTRTTASGGRPIIPVDWHSHVITPSELRHLAGRTGAPRVLTDAAGATRLQNLTTVSAAAREPSAIAASDIASRLAHLDANGIQRQLLTYTVALGYDATLPLDEQRAFFRGLNDDLAAILAKHPGRFLGVAAVPTGDPAWAAGELERAHRDLGLIGVALPLNAFATLESARTQAPVFAAAQRHGSHVFVHRGPANPALPGQPPLVVPEDTGAIRWSVISNTHLVNGAITLGLTDFLDPYPDVTVQVIMLGGFLPYIIDSIVASGQRAGITDPLARLRRIYLEPGPYSSSSGEWVALAAAKLGADRILFGTDYGVGGGVGQDRLATAIATLDRVLDPGTRATIYAENSERLLRARGLL